MSTEGFVEGTAANPAGGTLAYVIRGDDEGRPVFFNHGTPGGRLSRHPDAGIYRRAGVRAIFYDRPGYGLSDREPGRSVSAAAGHVRAIADALGIDRFGVWGGSGGGPHALACGALLADRVTRVIVFCGAAPTDDPEWDSWDGEADINLREFAAAREGMEAFELETAPYVERARADPVSALDYLAEHVPEPDRRVITRPEFRTAFAEHAAEPFRNGIAGWLDDDLAFLKPWGFRLEDVHVPVRLWQGADDLLVPRRHGEYLASKLPNARLELLPDTGHFLIDHMAAALSWLAE